MRLTPQKENPSAAAPGSSTQSSEQLSKSLTGRDRAIKFATPQALAASLEPIISRVRTDVTAIKNPAKFKGSRWTSEPLNAERLKAHVSGGMSRGVCPIKAGESTTRIAVLDFDSHKGETPFDTMLEVATQVADSLTLYGLEPVAWRSSGGKGVHLYVLWDEPQDAYSVRQALRDVLATCGYEDGAKGVSRGQVEVYPRQDEVAVGEYGNQFILPLSGESTPLDLELGMALDRAAALQLHWPVSLPVPRRERPVREVADADGVEPLSKVTAALAAVPTADLDYFEWHRLVCAAHEATGGSDEGLEAVLQWSASHERHDEKFVRERVWPYVKSERANGVTRATLFDTAKRKGWSMVPVASPEGFTDAGPFAILRTLTDAQLRQQWPSMGADMSISDEAAAREEVHRRLGVGKRILAAQVREERERRSETAQQRQAAGRKIIRHAPEDSYKQAAEVGRLILQDENALVLHADRPARIVSAPPLHMHAADSDSPAPAQVIIEAHTRSSILAAAESKAIIVAKGGPIAWPAPILDHLLNGDPARAPRVAGIAAHPFAGPSGEIIATNGLHQPTGILLHGCIGDSPRAYSRTEAQEALRWLRTHFLSGFEFATKLDADVALAGLLTGVQRPLLDIAPGLAILAAAQSSGKTTLARRIHLILTGRDLAVSNLRMGDDAEVEKTLLATLLSAPAMLCMDNVADGLTLALSVLNAALTSSTFEGRLLGATKMVRVSTRTLLVVTGNNLRLGADETSRMMVSRLAPSTARAETRTFRHPDVIGHTLSIRHEALRHAVGIVAGWLSSRHRLELAEGSRFPQWDRHVRQALIWSGGEDVAQVFRNNDQAAEHLQSLRTLIRELHSEFGNFSFNSRDVVNRCCSTIVDATKRERVCDALEAMSCRKTDSARSVGRCLTAVIDRPVLLDGATFRLSGRVDRDGVSRFVVSKGA